MNPLAMSEFADEGVMLRLWMIMSVLVCVELPRPGRESGARDRPIDVCSRLSALVCLRAVNGDVCVCVFPSLDCTVEKKVASQRPIVPSSSAAQLCLTGTGASGRLRTVQSTLIVVREGCVVC